MNVAQQSLLKTRPSTHHSPEVFMNITLNSRAPASATLSWSFIHMYCRNGIHRIIQHRQGQAKQTPRRLRRSAKQSLRDHCSPADYKNLLRKGKKSIPSVRAVQFPANLDVPVSNNTGLPAPIYSGRQRFGVCGNVVILLTCRIKRRGANHKTGLTLD
jgi:hypothetical protein